MTKLSTISCDYFPTCPGCQIQENVTLPPIALEMQTQFTFPLFHKEIIHWRTRAKLAVRGDAQIGLFKRGTHDVVDIATCPLHHPAIYHAIPLLKKALKECHIPSYNEQTHEGCLRYVQFVVERATGLVQLTLVVKENKNLEPLIHNLSKQKIWHSIWTNVQPLPINRIFGDTWHHSFGNENLYETLGGNQICFHPACFGQAHLSLFEEMLVSIQKKIFQNQRVVEFYAGVGVIGLSVAPLSKSVLCVEMNPFAKESFEKSSSFPNASFLEAPTEKALGLLNEADVVIVDPPRKGLEKTFLEELNASSAQQLIYVSCGPRSFKRDQEVLLEAGWKMENLEGYLLFPGTDHVELLGVFQRAIR